MLGEIGRGRANLLKNVYNIVYELTSLQVDEVIVFKQKIFLLVNSSTCQLVNLKEIYLIFIPNSFPAE